MFTKKGGCFKPASIGGNPSGTMQKSSSDEDIDTDPPEELLLFHADPRHAERQKSALRHGSPMRDPMAGRPLRTRKRNGKGDPTKKLVPSGKGK
ncbi:MAG: hypothetical protein C6W57_14160 [Caldibacillus debilis]|nr:MAG: hypothetical protein C6W57_14160 [Caldibacillus debilis]